HQYAAHRLHCALPGWPERLQAIQPNQSLAMDIVALGVAEAVSLLAGRALHMQVGAPAWLGEKDAEESVTTTQSTPETRLAPASCVCLIQSQPDCFGIGTQRTIEHLAQVMTCSMQTCLQGAQGEIQPGGHLALWQLHQVAEFDHFTRAAGERAEGPIQQRSHVLAVEHLNWIKDLLI